MLTVADVLDFNEEQSDVGTMDESRLTSRLAYKVFKRIHMNQEPAAYLLRVEPLISIETMISGL